jgi:choline dehydrogenase-like flavoprotein
VTDGREVSEDTELECEVVVVGTGAGGAAVAHELACRGRAVLLLEEGDYHRRADFTGRASTALRRYYRDRGITFALGNVGVPVWAGRMVGGSTTINSGTCYRTPERTFRYWRERHGLPSAFSAQGLAPYFDRVEAMLEVARAELRHTGGVGRVIARGAAALGYDHGPLPRNAPGCDGQGMCCYGCPTGAKRSTEVSYIPAALQRGAQLITGARVDRVSLVAGRARGVVATLASGRTLRVKAEATVVAGGALMTPLLLARSGACQGSGWLGKNLSIHPAAQVLAMFDEEIDMGRGIPQGYGIESFAEEGLMFEGCSTPPDVLSVGIPWSGRRLMDLMDNYRRLAVFGFMIQDHSRGTVREGPGGSPVITYSMNERDAALCQRGLTLLSEVFLEAGARRVFPFALGHGEITDRRGLEALRQARLKAGDFDVAAFHPLGTCRMGVDPRKSCVGPDQQAHDTQGLYVCDGSVMPSSLGVNPQLTIMAMSLRAGEFIDQALG